MELNGYSYVEVGGGGGGQTITIIAQADYKLAIQPRPFCVNLSSAGIIEGPSTLADITPSTEET